MAALPFVLSIAVLSLAQALTVALARPMPKLPLHWLGGPSAAWALLPALSLALFVLLLGSNPASAQGLSYLALLAVPALAALALAQRSVSCALVAVPVAFALAWFDRDGLFGESSALCLDVLSCAALGGALAMLSGRRLLTAGICAMALLDSALVAGQLLQRPNSALNGAHPAAGLPRLQSALFGSAVMGYGDLFVAAAFGGLLAVHHRRALQRPYAVLVALLALAMDLLFLLVSTLPATVPVAVASILLELRHGGEEPARDSAQA